jgi:glycosyltransferase involved in cell wall biosynthesis
MRVLYFAERFWPHIGGIEVISARLVPALAQRGYEMLVVTGRDHEWMPAAERFGPVEIRRVAFARALAARDLDVLARARSEMNQIIREFRPHLIHSLFGGAGVWLLPRTSVAPRILSMHGSWELNFSSDSGLFGRAVSQSDWVTACSRWTLDDLLRAAPQMTERSSVIHNGLDPTFEGDPPEPPSGPPVLFCSGRLVHEKGIDLAIEALRSTDADVRLVIAGDGEERTALTEQAKAAGLSDRITFTGWVSPEQIHQLVATASIVLVPSRKEGFGLVALEAALMARPVIATRVGGLPEVVEDGVSGIVVPSDDADALGAAIGRLLASPEEARHMGHAGHRRALAKFSAGRHLNDWDALYQHVEASSRRT